MPLVAAFEGLTFRHSGKRNSSIQERFDSHVGSAVFNNQSSITSGSPTDTMYLLSVGRPFISRGFAIGGALLDLVRVGLLGVKFEHRSRLHRAGTDQE